MKYGVKQYVFTLKAVAQARLERGEWLDRRRGTAAAVARR
jgi:hypothetical protein